ncbi:MAG: DUF6311 domain-containing protein [Christensenellaceae bacterium]|jgi:hypothetical protein
MSEAVQMPGGKKPGQLQKKPWYRQDVFLLLVISFGLGLFFSVLFYGAELLDVTNIGWVSSGDNATHYVGWHAYQHADWQKNFVAIDNVVSPFRTTIGLSDSIPLFALFFKLFQGILPSYFNYFGLWCVFIYWMQIFFGALIVRRKTKSLLVMVLGGALFAASMPFTYRLFTHSALGGQFVLLAAIYVMLEYRSMRHANLAWIAVIVVSMLIHPYLTFMCLILLCGNILNILLDKSIRIKSKLIDTAILLGGSLGALLAIGYALGYFSHAAESMGGFGIYSMNLNALVNPLSSDLSLFMPAMPHIEGQSEGMMYLGLPIIIVLVFLAIVRNKKLKQDFLSAWGSGKAVGVLAACIVLFLLAVSNVVTLGGDVLFTVPLGEPLLKLLNIFRVSARMFWPVFYFIYVLALYGLIKVFGEAKPLKGKLLPIVLCALVALQFADLSKLILIKRSEIQNRVSYSTSLTSDFWEACKGKFDHIVFMPYILYDDYFDMAVYAIDNDMAFNGMTVARLDYAKMNEYLAGEIEKMKNGTFDKDSLYVIRDSEWLTSNPGLAEHLYIANVDGYTVLFDKGHPELAALTDGM